MAQSGFVWVNKISVLGNIKADLALVDVAAKNAIDEHLNDLEKIVKSEKRLKYGFGVKTGHSRGAYRHNPVISSGGIARGETFNDVEYIQYLEFRWGSKYKNWRPSITESQLNLDKIISDSFKNILNL